MKRWHFIWLLTFTLPVLGQNGNLLPDTINICGGDSGFVELRNRYPFEIAVEWTTPAGIITNVKKLRATRAGEYRVRISAAGQMQPQTDSCYVRFIRRPAKQLRDTVVCKGRNVILNAGNPGMKYFWNTGETTQKITVASPGVYNVRVSHLGCQTSDTCLVRSIQALATPLASDVLFCVNEESKVIGMKVSPGTRTTWNTGATTPTINVGREGTFWVRSEHPLCGSQTDSIHVKFKMCECEMMIPNSFTPNDDNRNDYFMPISQCDYSYFVMTITDRWGNVIYTSNHQGAKWDGRFKGNLCPEDIYIYKIETVEKTGEKKQVRTGHISLFR